VGVEDISAAQIVADRSNSHITITMPSVRMLGNDIISQEVFDEEHNIFVPIMASDVFNEIDKARKEYEVQALEKNLIAEAEQQVEKILRLMFVASGFKNISIFFARNSLDSL
ncbi:MAG: DUF4230 domain-containing protein, partial [Treponemataceae bacterium]